MTALKKYQRLEATGLWRPAPDAQRREVIVSIGDATLVITDTKDQPLTHWSLAAIDRQNPGERPAIFSPDGDAGETLELSEEEDSMIRAIEKLRTAITRARPRPGRLRLVSVVLSCLGVAALGVFWLPGAAQRHALSVVPEISRQAIGEDVLTRIMRVTGPECTGPSTEPVLAALAARIGVRRIAVLPEGVNTALSLPGGLVALNRAVIETHEDPDVAAGFVLAARTRAELTDPLADLLDHAGVTASFQLMTTGVLAPEALDGFARAVVAQPRPALTDTTLLTAFEAANLRSTPYAYALDPSGETTQPLIDGDPMTGQRPVPVLRDRDWLLLQAICES